jgi:hypothetical protein
MAEAAQTLRVSRTYSETIDVELLELADDIRHDTYMRDITEDERVSYNESILSLSEQIYRKEDEKKAMMKMLADELKALKASHKAAVKISFSGQIEEADKIATFLDHDTRTAHEYNSKGERITKRRLRPEERQMKSQF